MAKQRYPPCNPLSVLDAESVPIAATRPMVDAEKSQQAERLRGLIWTSMRIISSC